MKKSTATLSGLLLAFVFALYSGESSLQAAVGAPLSTQPAPTQLGVYLAQTDQ